MHDKTRRRILLAAFWTLCAAPTLIVLACGLFRRLPGHARREAERLSTHLAVRVSLSRLRHPRPGVTVYEGLKLSDPETRRVILRCGKVQAGWQDSIDRESRQRSALILVAFQPEIEAAELPQLWRLLERVLCLRAGWRPMEIRWTATELKVNRDGDPWVLSDVRGSIQTLPEGALAKVAFRPPSVETSEPAWIRVVRNRRTQPPATGFDLYTGGAALPCSTLAPGLPTLESLGPQSRFCGYLWANLTPGGWTGELSGQFDEVDLGKLFEGRLTHRFTGVGLLTVQLARFHAGRLQRATGSLVAGPGLIGRSLIDACTARLDMAGGWQLPAGVDPIPYERLAASFLMDSSGLELRGECPGTPTGVMMTSRYGPLLGEPAVQPLPAAALLQAVEPAGMAQAPLTRLTEWLARRLPVAAEPTPREAKIGLGPNPSSRPATR